MASFKVTGGQRLHGTIRVGGAKNAALKILPAAILANSTSTISNVPRIIDIEKMIHILESIGTKIAFEGNTVTIDPTNIHSSHPDEKLVKKLRGSVVLVGALLAKFGKAVFSEPGGCLIGSRAIDDHIDLFRQMKVKVTKKGDTYILQGKPQAGTVILSKMSVTATENAILASVFCKGKMDIHVAAAEPEIVDLANYLNAMGAKIEGAGTHDIIVTGVSSLSGVKHEVMPDRIEAGTYIITGLVTNSEITVGPIAKDTLDIFFKKLYDCGAHLEYLTIDGQQYVKTKRHGVLLAHDIDTRPYPGFPTDLQSPYAVLMTQAKGRSHIFETLFEGRYAYIEQLKLLRADAEILNPHEFSIVGPRELVGTDIVANDIRGGVALVIAALIAKKQTLIEEIEYIDRGYENLDVKLRSLGAKIERV